MHLVSIFFLQNGAIKFWETFWSAEIPRNFLHWQGFRDLIWAAKSVLEYPIFFLQTVFPEILSFLPRGTSVREKY